MEAMAPAIGIPAATNPPKTNTMTMNDKGRAIPSPACRSVSIWWVMASTSGPTPPTEPVAPGNAATMASNCCCAAAWAAVRCAVVEVLRERRHRDEAAAGRAAAAEERRRLRVLETAGQQERRRHRA